MTGKPYLHQLGKENLSCGGHDLFFCSREDRVIGKVVGEI